MKIRNTLIVIFCVVFILLIFAFSFISKDDVNRRLEKEFNLNDYNNDITITEQGIYTLSGKLNHSIIVDADGEVTLNLHGVDINSEETSAIVNISGENLIINVVDNTVNNLTDEGKSDYDGCIYSSGNIYIEGSGTLNIYGKQKNGEGISTTDSDITINNGNIYIESKDDGINAGGDNSGTITINNGNVQIKANGDGIDSNNNIIINGGTIYSVGSSKGRDASIDADNGFEINGGLVIGIGSDMLQIPSTSSKQNTICFDLDEVIEEGSLITLLNNENYVIVSFVAKEDFRTLIISSEKLEKGIYSLYKDGDNNGKLLNDIYIDSNYEKGNIVTVTNNIEFKIDSNITKVE